MDRVVRCGLTERGSTTLRWSLLFALLMIGNLACTSATPDQAWFTVGMSRAAVIEQFGEPDRQQTLRKTDEAIWGAIETFWAEVPTGSEVEIWYFPTRVELATDPDSSNSDGTTELYFVDGSDVVRGVGFAPRGAVFESGSQPARHESETTVPADTTE